MGGRGCCFLCICVRGVGGVSRVPYPVPSLASGALLACSCSSVGGGPGRSCFPYLVGGGVRLPPCLPLHTTLLLRADGGLVVLVVSDMPSVPYVCVVRGWTWSLSYTSLFSLSMRLPSCFSWRRSVALHGN